MRLTIGLETTSGSSKEVSFRGIDESMYLLGCEVKPVFFSFDRSGPGHPIDGALRRLVLGLRHQILCKETARCPRARS